MTYTNLGRTGLKVSRLALGTMNFGPKTSEDESHAILDRAIELGINLIDTADIYGYRKAQGTGAGWTEEIIGRWLAHDSGRRDRIVLATKVFSRMGDGVNDQGLSARHIRRACEASLRRVQTDHIDLYQMHHVDRETPWEEIWQAMEQLIRDGKILYVGSANSPGWQLATSQQVAAHRHLLGLASEQSVYNLATRAIESEVIPACRHYGLGLLAWSPLAGGLLAGSADPADQGRRAAAQVREQADRWKDQVARYETLCADMGEPPATVALAWVLANPVVTAAIIGPRTRSQLEASLRALDLRLSEDMLRRLDTIWPGPGEAPEGYAW